MNLYEELGVPKNATDAAIHSAYRKKAKKAHPDAGGSRDKFQMLQLANDTLSDPELRKRYDETGEIHRKMADQGRNETLVAISQWLDGIVGEAIKQNIDPENLDVIQALVGCIMHQIQPLNDRIADIEKRKRIYAKMQKRFRRKKKDADNIMEALIAGRLETMEQDKRLVTIEKKKLEDALAIVQDHTFEHVMRAFATQVQGLGGGFFNATTVW